MPPQDRILYPLLWSKSKGIPQEKVSFLNWMHEKWVPSLPERLLRDLSLLFTSVIATSLIANYLILCYICGYLVGTLSVYAYIQILSALGGAIYTLTLINIFFHRRNFLHRLSAIIMGLETKCLGTAGIFRDWIHVKFLSNISKQLICVISSIYLLPLQYTSSATDI